MANLKTFEGRELLSADRSEADLPPSDGVDGGADDKDGKNEKDDASSSSSGKSLSIPSRCSNKAWFASSLLRNWTHSGSDFDQPSLMLMLNLMNLS